MCLCAAAPPPPLHAGSPTSSAAADVGNLQARALVEIDVTNAMATGVSESELLGTGRSRSGKKGGTGDGSEVFRVGTTSGALSKRQEAIVRWIQSLGVPVIRNEGSTDEQSGARHQRQTRISTHTLAMAVMYEPPPPLPSTLTCRLAWLNCNAVRRRGVVQGRRIPV